MKLKKIQLQDQGYFFAAYDSNDIVVFENKRIPFTGNSELYLSEISKLNTNIKYIFIDTLNGSDLDHYNLIEISKNTSKEKLFFNLPKSIKEMVYSFYKEGVDYNYPKFMQNTFSKKRENILNLAIA